MAALLMFKSVTLVRAAVAGGAEAATAMVPPARAEPPPPAAPPVTTPIASPAASPAAASAGDAAISDTERALLLDLRRRRGEIEAQESALAEREAVLAAAEKRLDARLDELAGLQHRLEAVEAARKERDEANWKGLVKLYETMKPRDAALIFNDLDLPVLLQVVDRMRETKAAPILAAMLPDRARQLTAELARFRARANTATPPAADAPAPGTPATNGKGKT
jgi:flagellar motility protein MotE (MotC chaperone)